MKKLLFITYANISFNGTGSFNTARGTDILKASATVQIRAKGDVANCISNHIYPTWNGWRGSTSLVRDIAVTLPKAKMTTIHNQVSFYTEFPELEQKHKVFLGNAETDTITNGTNPTLEEWKQMKVNGDFINVQDATVDMVYPATLYKKTLKQMKVR